MPLQSLTPYIFRKAVTRPEISTFYTCMTSQTRFKLLRSVEAPNLLFMLARDQSREMCQG